jgi:acyl-coenzyme A thioesterase PaaI-like protein
MFTLSDNASMCILLTCLLFLLLLRDVCGFPQTVHGGLTAAIMDETFGGLGVSLWKSGTLGFRPPAYTAHLEVDYKKKIPAGTVIKCSTGLQKIEDRKASGT